MQHYLIRSNINYEEKKVIGQTIVQLKPLADNFISFELDAAGMTIDSVTLDDANSGGAGKSLQYKTLGEKLIITLDRAYTGLQQ